MRTAEPMTENEQAHRLIENFAAHLAHGKEWATPGVQAALQKAVTGLDAGVETASPRVQALLRRLADDLAGGVETLTPRVQERLRRAVPQAGPDLDLIPVESGQPGSRKWLWLAGVLAMIMAAAGAVAWRSSQATDEEPPAPQAAVDAGQLDADPDLTAGRS